MIDTRRLEDRLLDIRNRDYFLRSAMERAKAGGLAAVEWLGEFDTALKQLAEHTRKEEGQADAPQDD